MAIVPFAEGISAEFKLRLFLVVPLFFCAIRFALVPPKLARHDKTQLNFGRITITKWNMTKSLACNRRSFLHILRMAQIMLRWFCQH